MTEKIAPPRALIIAIEKYPEAVGMATELQGSNNAGDEFWKWFVEKKVQPLSTNENPLDPKDLVFGCVDHPYEWRTAGTTRAAILSQLKALVNKGRDKTSELYFFFSGHGFSYTDMGWTRAIDVLVASEFTTRNDSGGACLKLQELQEMLWNAMGPGDHYYFIDACRNTTTHAEIKVLETGLTLTPSSNKKPYLYTLYSTVKGMAAEVDSGFSPALVSGLRGSGRAKGWDQDNTELWVKFDLLVDYVARQLPEQTVDPKIDGNGKGRILHLIPIPESECKIKINKASQTDKFQLLAKTPFGQKGPYEFQGDSFSVKLRPFLYNLELTHSALPVIQIDPPPSKVLDLYDNCEVKFELAPTNVGGGAPPPAPPPPQESVFEFSAPMVPGSEIEVTNVLAGTTIRGVDLPAPRSTVGPRRARRSGKAAKAAPELLGAVEPGTYMLKMRERGVVVGRREVTVEAGERLKIDLLERPESKTRQDILKAIANEPDAKVAVFSDLGPTANLDVSLWLSLFGCGKILGPEVKKELERFDSLDLESFDDIKAGGACVYVLAAFEKSAGKFGVGVSKTNKVAWQQLKPVPQLTSVYQWRQLSRPGPCLLSLQLPEQVPITFATYCLPNRATFMVLAEDEAGRVAVRHYMLPIGKLIDNIDRFVSSQIKSNPLNLVRYMSLVQSQFARKRSLEPTEENSAEAEAWRELVYGKWLDPVMCLIAAYYFIRNGKAGPNADQNDKSLLNTMLGNLRTYFGELPDVAAIERMLGKKTKLPAATPLILDGVLSFQSNMSKVLALPQSQLDYAGPWTCWRGAVNSFKS